MNIKYLNFILIFTILATFSVPRFSLAAASATELNQQIADTNKQIEKLNAQIKAYQDQIDKTHEVSTTLKNAISELTLTRSKLIKQVEQTTSKIKLAGSVINKLDATIDEKEKEIEMLEESLKASLYDIYQSDNSTFLESLLSENTVTFTEEVYARESINRSAEVVMNDISNVKDALEESRVKKQVEKDNLTKLKNKLDQDKKVIEVVKKEKDTLLKETKNKEILYQKLLLEQQKKRDAFEKDLRDYESQLKFILNPSLLPKAGSGVLSWPLDKVFVTQLFGRTVAAKRLYVSGSHSGVDFRASTGTEVKAMASGTVMGVGDTDKFCKGASFGKWVFIKYNNGLSSTFGHLSVISATVGQNVSAGDVVGLSGNTGHSTGPHLHVAVYASQGSEVRTVPSLSCAGSTFVMPIAPVTAYLDPLLYLPSTTGDMFKADNSKD
jgi:murein DD-endopeptidase MepM/ murein hydrolase activator NlpD